METTETGQYGTPSSLPPAPAISTGSAPVKGKKRKRIAKPPRESLVEPESSDPDEEDWDMDNQLPPLPLLSPSWEPDPGDADFFRPSVVTRVPGLKAQMKQAVRQSYRAASADSVGASSGSAYEGKKPKKKGQKSKAKASANNKSSGAEVDSDGRPARKRTKTGCWTCRNRKLKCDENRPQCSQCARSRPPRECSYPEDNDSTPAGTYS